MTDQLAFTFDPSIARRFEEFHEANPKVYVVLVRLAREWVARTGRTKLGIKTLYERARWEIALATSDPDFKLNNNYTAYYARLIMHREPDLADMFDLRSSEADAWLATYTAGHAA
ncbi:hypothetical protein [Mycobacterium asiaticum]|uniref:Uncharacterized protein n=1 Tax=Mycobacterium asiaticum TaxID=1790 RepID=A0A1A3NQF0_MYCAS|nr:hypothetical protein [Mycobacterium asiaticum]OBK22532.1 hypothetical protein A5635_21695 [Mycobacterium asiaticum]